MVDATRTVRLRLNLRARLVRLLGRDWTRSSCYGSFNTWQSRFFFERIAKLPSSDLADQPECRFKFANFERGTNQSDARSRRPCANFRRFGIEHRRADADEGRQRNGGRDA